MEEASGRWQALLEATHAERETAASELQALQAQYEQLQGAAAEQERQMAQAAADSLRSGGARTAEQLLREGEATSTTIADLLHARPLSAGRTPERITRAYGLHCTRLCTTVTACSCSHASASLSTCFCALCLPAGPLGMPPAGSLLTGVLAGLKDFVTTRAVSPIEAPHTASGMTAGAAGQARGWSGSGDGAAGSSGLMEGAVDMLEVETEQQQQRLARWGPASCCMGNCSVPRWP